MLTSVRMDGISVGHQEEGSWESVTIEDWNGPFELATEAVIEC
jgi:hypothetical protein